jgi:dTDP-4-dehydrorhamnose reductase
MDPASVQDCLQRTKPDVIVSAAAYTAVDKAEAEQDEAFAVNGAGAGAVAAAAAFLGVPVIHLSTDYVFDGLKTAPYVETDPTGPATVYGRSKLAGEHAVSKATPNHVILRTAWVYSEYGHNFIKTMLRLAETRDTISVVSDQVGCPSSADDIASAVLSVAELLLKDRSADLRGIFHLSGSGETSWAGLAKHIFSIVEELTGKRISVQDIKTEDYPTPARRPANSRLDCRKFEQHYHQRLPLWQASVCKTVVNLLTKESQ